MTEQNQDTIQVFELVVISNTNQDLPAWSRRAGYDHKDGQIYLPVELFTDNALQTVTLFKKLAVAGEGLSTVDGGNGRPTILGSASFLRRAYPDCAKDINLMETSARRVITQLLERMAAGH
jgi:hypothetical protein